MDDTPTPTPPPTAAGPARRRRGLAWAALACGALLALVMGVLAVVATLPSTEPGTRWLLGVLPRLLPGLSVESPQGALRGSFTADRLVYRLGPAQTIELEHVHWQGLALRHDAGGWRLHIPTLEIDRIAVVGHSASSAPTVLPTDLVLPLAVQVDALHVGRLEADALGDQPLRDLRLALSLGAGRDALHRVDGLQVRWEQLQAQGRLQVQAAAPLGLEAQLALAPVADGTPAGLPSTLATLADEWQAQLAAHGPLANFTATATVRARGQALDAEATVQPATALGLTSLRATAQAFDLAALSAQWPRTALSGDVNARLDAPAATDASQPLTLTVRARNALAGKVGEGKLPLRSLSVTASSQADSPGHGDIRALAVELGTANAAAGRIEAQGRWGPRGGTSVGTNGQPLAVDLATTLTDLRPAQLDDRAPAIVLGGTLQLGWQSPSQGSVRGTLRGQVLSTQASAHPQPQGQPVTVTLDAQGSPDAVALRSLEAAAGAARLAAHGEATHGANGWATSLAATWQAFDPSLWWPSANPAWRRGPHRLDGQLQATLRLADKPPSTTGKASNASLLTRLQGQASAQLAPSSVLAGVPLAGTLRFDSSGAPVGVGTSASGKAPQFDARFTLGSGVDAGDLTVSGSIDPRDTPAAADRWTLRWSLPALAPFTPWLRLAQGSTGAAPVAALASARAPGSGALPTPATAPAVAPLGWRGDLAGELTLAGRWPQVQVSGSTRSHLLAVGTEGQPANELRELAAQWQLGSQPGDALTADLHAVGAKLAGLRLENPALQLSGTGAAHRLALTSLAILPATADSPERRLQASVQAEGGWFDAASGWGWQGRLAELTLRDAPSQSAGPSALPWLSLPPTALRWLQQGAHRELTVEATRLSLADAVLALEPARWAQDGDGAPQFTLRGQLEPWAVAPLLARTQPGFGWAGDLRVAGRIDLQATPQRFTANVLLQRERGDLQVLDTEATASGNAQGQTQSLGLTDLRLALQADQGQWRLTELLAGSRVGRIDGEQRVQAPAAAWVPPASAPLAGQLSLQVAQLGQLGNIGHWLPPGWRLAGQLAGQARLAGRLDAPLLSGELRGDKIAVRNLLEGVDWHDATLRLALDGERARIEQLDILAGAGRLSATGSAQLGAAPTLTLQARADHFAALQRVDRRVVVSGQADVMLDPTTTRVTAQLSADEGRFDISHGDAPALADDVQVRRASDPALPVDSVRSGGSPGAPGAGSSGSPGPARGMVGGTGPAAPQTQLDIRADLGPAFTLRGRGVNTRLAGTLRLTSPANKLQVAGTIRAVDGTYAAYGQKLGIERGLVVFAGTPDNPRLDILATRSDLDEVRVGVAITGTAQAPRVRLYSDPSLSDTDKLSWLMLGRASDGLGGTDLALLQRAAFALLSGESDSPGVVQRLGLDTLSVGQKDDGTVRDTVVSLGKQLSRRWYLGYERSLQTTTGSWQLIYRLAQRFTLRAQSGSAENALDLIWTWKWGV
jgi:translocation and assembly module TamB